MSKLDELIKELCPDGVEYKTLGEVCEFRAGWGFPEAEQGLMEGKYPFYKVGDMNNSEMFMDIANNYISEETSKKLKCKPAPKGTIIFPKIGATMNTNKKRILTKDSCYDNNVMGIIAKTVNDRFLYYFFSQYRLIDFAKGTGAVPSLDTNRLKNLELPVPPLPVQEEIVRILDTFTELTTELTAELTARRKQYEYYRDSLLTRDTKVEVKKLADICKTTNNIKWKDEKGDYQYIDLTSVDRENHSITETIRINSSNAPSRAQQIVKENDVLFGTTRPMLKRTAFITKDFDNQICSTGYCVLRADTELVNPRYIYHQISTSDFYQYVEAHQQGASYPAISDSDVKKYTIPLPSLDVQERIVNVLDNFDAICSDLKIGLPAEIEARQKQYEYYRDKLLAFKRKEAV